MKNEETSKEGLSEPGKPTSAAESTGATSSNAEEQSNVTTENRKPLEIPDSVHVRIAPDNLKDYVGPPVYQKDRMYVHPPPPGVSTGLGYLGNGSGAVMPVEASVSWDASTFEKAPFLIVLHCLVLSCALYLVHARKGRPTVNR